MPLNALGSILVGTTFTCFKTIQNPVNQYVTGFCFLSKTTKNRLFSPTLVSNSVSFGKNRISTTD